MPQTFRFTFTACFDGSAEEFEDCYLYNNKSVEKYGLDYVETVDEFDGITFRSELYVSAETPEEAYKEYCEIDLWDESVKGKVLFIDTISFEDEDYNEIDI